MQAKAFVTGATGFIGSHLVESLLKKGFVIRAFVRKSSDIRWLKNLNVELVYGDLREEGFSAERLKGVTDIFHVGGVIEAPSKKDYFDVNAGGTRRLLEAASKCGTLKKFVFISSQAAGGPSNGKVGVKEDHPPHPVSYYGQSKLAAEKEVLAFSTKFPVVILRPPTIYGPRDTRVFTAFRMLKRGFALAAGFGEKWISFCYITDLVEAILLAGSQSRAEGKIYNVAGDRAYEWLELVEEMGRALCAFYRIYRLPRPLFYFLGWGGEIYTALTRRSTVFTRERVREFLQNSWVIDGARIRGELGWEERVALREGISVTANWYQEAGWF